MAKERRIKFKISGRLSDHLISILTILILITISGKASSLNNQPDVISYHLKIEPNIDKGTIQGSVVINFQTNSDSLIFKSGDLETIQRIAETKW